jgi:ribose transport system substrate-binding protein
MKMIQDEQLVVAEVGEPLEWIGWANMDQVLRVLTGTDPVQSENTPLRLFDASNIDEAGTPPSQTDGYGSPDEFKSRYMDLWGLS